MDEEKEARLGAVKSNLQDKYGEKLLVEENYASKKDGIQLGSSSFLRGRSAGSRASSAGRGGSANRNRSGKKRIGSSKSPIRRDRRPSLPPVQKQMTHTTPGKNFTS